MVKDVNEGMKRHRLCAFEAGLIFEPRCRWSEQAREVVKDSDKVAKRLCRQDRTRGTNERVGKHDWH